MDHPEYSVVEVEGLQFKMTCGACPEQYDVFDGDEKIGYVRLRHGELTVEAPDCGGTLLLNTGEVEGDGVFEDDERGKWLPKIAAILSAHQTVI